MSNDAVNTLRITLSDSTPTQDDSLQLEQIKLIDETQDVTLPEIEKMVERAKSGVSAKTVIRESCPMLVDALAKTITVLYDIAVLPSRIDLDFALSTNIGALTIPMVSREFVEFSVIFNNSATAEIGFLLTDISHTKWEYQPHTPEGVRLTAKAVSVSGTRLVVDEPICGVVRIAGRKLFKSCQLAVVLEKDNIKVDELNPVVIATWAGDPIDLPLETPRCTADALAWCPGDPSNPFFNEDSGTGSETGLSSTCTETTGEEKEGSYSAYYSKCSGDVIMVVRNDDGGCL